MFILHPNGPIAALLLHLCNYRSEDWFGTSSSSSEDYTASQAKDAAKNAASQAKDAAQGAASQAKSWLDTSSTTSDDKEAAGVVAAAY